MGCARGEGNDGTANTNDLALLPTEAGTML